MPAERCRSHSPPPHFVLPHGCRWRFENASFELGKCGPHHLRHFCALHCGCSWEDDHSLSALSGWALSERKCHDEQLEQEYREYCEYAHEQQDEGNFAFVRDWRFEERRMDEVDLRRRQRQLALRVRGA